MMEQVALDKGKQKKLNKKVDRLKEKVRKGTIKINEKSSKPKRLTKKKEIQRGAIYIARIPHGFYEDELKSYFSQFGRVTRVKLGRSKKTGRSKGYAFVEFLHSDIAKIAAETMNNYLMFNCILKCRYIPPEEQYSRMFVRTIYENKYPRSKNRMENINNKNRVRTKEEEDSQRAKTERKIEDFKKFFQERGIEFNFKINCPQMSVNGKSDAEEDSESSGESEMLTDDQFGVLEIDESEDEIQFKTPPQVKKVIKRYSVHRNSNINQAENCGNKRKLNKKQCSDIKKKRKIRKT